jgi:diacylglycerol kinase (ATP)
MHSGSRSGDAVHRFRYSRGVAVKRTVIIVNPRSSGGAAGKRWSDLADTIGRVLPFDEAITNAPGHATELARQALRSGADQVIALGGDGTINETINGFFDEDGQLLPEAKHAQFGVIPYGTGGDFRRTLGLPQDITAAAKVVAAGNVKRCDVGRLTYTTADGAAAVRMFINIASFGVSGEVDRMVNQSSKRLGRLSFFVATARATLGYKNQRVSLVFDGNTSAPVEATISTVAVANGQYFGGAMQIAPHAEIDDGKFDVICMGDLSFADLVTSGQRLYKGTHLTMDKVSSRRATTVRAEPIEGGARIEIDLDGENVVRLPATFEMVANTVNLLVPSGA